MAWWSDERRKRHNRACAVMALWANRPVISEKEVLPTFPNRQNVVVWLGIQWKGVPKPLRWWAKIKGIRLTGPLDGCGCCRRLRCWWYSHEPARELRRVWARPQRL